MKRPPIVVVMGHVDHGKTTLLDYIRIKCGKAAPKGGEPRPVAGREAGGITQSVGAYEISHNNQLITFIDTPGHEAFSKMRQRGAKAADLGILVVAGDDSVQNQTKEAFKILEESKTSVIVAINKIDKPRVDINRVKSDLAQAGILVEGYGGNISWQAISAKTGQGVNELLDLVLLASEMDPPAGGLEYNPEAPAEGFILESKMDNKKGITVTGIIKNGKLKTGEEIFAPGASGKVKSLENFLGKRIAEAVPSNPVLILGFTSLPKVGDDFTTNPNFKDQISNKIVEQKILSTDTKAINLLLKADASGTLETLSLIINNLPDKDKINIISEGVGEITDGDIKNASSSGAMIIGFRVKPNRAAEALAKVQLVKLITSEIVYELIKIIEDNLKSIGKEIILGELEILAVFGKKGGNKQIVGGKILSGEIKNNSILEIRRGDQVMGTGRVVNLQKGKEDAKKVEEGSECGLLFGADVIINVGDHLVSKS